MSSPDLSNDDRRLLVKELDDENDVLKQEIAQLKGHEDFVAQELQLEARIIRQRRERRPTAEG